MPVLFIMLSMPRSWASPHELELPGNKSNTWHTPWNFRFNQWTLGDALKTFLRDYLDFFILMRGVSFETTPLSDRISEWICTFDFQNTALEIMQDFRMALFHINVVGHEISRQSLIRNEFSYCCYVREEQYPDFIWSTSKWDLIYSVSSFFHLWHVIFWARSNKGKKVLNQICWL